MKVQSPGDGRRGVPPDFILHQLDPLEKSVLGKGVNVQQPLQGGVGEVLVHVVHVVR